MSPPVRKQWWISPFVRTYFCFTEGTYRGIASKITREERDDAVSKLNVYREWFARKVMRIGERNTIVVLPIEEISPRYRDENPWLVSMLHHSCPADTYESRDFYPKGVPMLFLSPILGGPELTIPSMLSKVIRLFSRLTSGQSGKYHMTLW